MQRRFVSVMLFLFLVLCVASSGLSAQTQYAFRVNFTNKTGVPYTLSMPTQYLSQRALERRNKYGVLLDSLDLPVSRVYIDSVLKRTQGKLHVTSRWFNQCVILLNDSSQISQLDGLSFVTSVKQVGAYNPGLHKLVNKDFSFVSSLAATQKITAWDAAYYNDSWSQTTLVHGDTLNRLGLSGKDLLIAIVDEGFAYTDTHPGFANLRASGRIVDVHNFVNANEVVYTPWYHGTQVLSTIAGYLPDSYVGAAPGASFALYCTEVHDSEQPVEMDNMVAGIERADSLGADIIHSSLGYNTFDQLPGNDITAAQLDGNTVLSSVAANIATRKGILFISSAGNEGTSTTEQNKLLTPGDADSVLTVGNVDAAGNVAGSSSMGPNASLVVKPDVCAMGNPAYVLIGTGVATADGTSFAAPQITGWAACLLESAPTASLYAIKECIRQSCDNYLNPQKQRGYGVPDFRVAYKILHPYTPIDPVAVDFVLPYPTIFQDHISLLINVAADQEINFVLYDISGKLVWKSGAKDYPAGYSTEDIYFPKAFSRGMYFFKATGATKSSVTRLIHY